MDHLLFFSNFPSSFQLPFIQLKSQTRFCFRLLPLSLPKHNRPSIHTSPYQLCGNLSFSKQRMRISTLSMMLIDTAIAHPRSDLNNMSTSHIDNCHISHQQAPKEQHKATVAHNRLKMKESIRLQRINRDNICMGQVQYSTL